jgi:hypothetical protein
MKGDLHFGALRYLPWRTSRLYIKHLSTEKVSPGKIGFEQIS